MLLERLSTLRRQPGIFMSGWLILSRYEHSSLLKGGKWKHSRWILDSNLSVRPCQNKVFGPTLSRATCRGENTFRGGRIALAHPFPPNRRPSSVVRGYLVVRNPTRYRQPAPEHRTPALTVRERYLDGFPTIPCCCHRPANDQIVSTRTQCFGGVITRFWSLDGDQLGRTPGLPRGI